MNSLLKFITILLALLNVYTFAQTSDEKLEFVKTKLEQVLDAAKIDGIEINSFEITANTLTDIFVNEKYDRFEFINWEKENGDSLTELVLYKEEGSEIGNFTLWFGTTHIPNSFTYIEGDIYTSGRKYHIYLSDDNRKDTRDRYGYPEYHSLWLKFSYIDKNAEDFIFFTTYYTDSSEIIEIAKYQNVDYFFESQKVEHITRYRYD